MVARLVRDQKVAGSNPVTSTFRKALLHKDLQQGFSYVLAMWLLLSVPEIVIVYPSDAQTEEEKR